MSKSRRNLEQVSGPEPARERAPGPSARTTRLSTLAGVALLVVVGALNLHETRLLRLGLDDRLGQIDDRLAKLASRVERSAAAPTPRGPDPSKVHEVRTDGAPVRGPATAPITIAEFSDFQ